MAQYDIYILDKSLVSVTGGKTLDGVTQGDGSHLMGETITLGPPSWYSVDITDDDTSFQDNDSGQRLDGPQTINGVSYGNGTVVEAEYSFTVSYGGQSWTLIGFNVNNSAPVFGTIEGIAVIGGPGSFPPSGVPLVVTGTAEGPNFAANSYATPICFASGTRIDVPGGTRAVEDLRPGDRVSTLHDGAQRLLWCGARLFQATPENAPIRFAPGVLGNAVPLRVSPQHRILVSAARAELMFCAADVLIPAKAFVNGTTVTQEVGGLVRYHHLLFARHQILFSDNVTSESFLPGAASLASLTRQARDEVLALMPRLRAAPGSYGRAAAHALRLFEGRALLAA